MLYFTTFINLQVCCSRQRLPIMVEGRCSAISTDQENVFSFVKEHLFALINTSLCLFEDLQNYLVISSFRSWLGLEPCLQVMTTQHSVSPFTVYLLLRSDAVLLQRPLCSQQSKDWIRRHGRCERRDDGKI